MQTVPLLRDRVEIAKFQLRILTGPDASRTIESTGSELTIGTGFDQQLRLTDQYVSRCHCVIRSTDEGLICEDLDSTNGTLVGDHRITGSVIRPGDMITVGETVLEVDLVGASISERLSLAESYGGVIGRSVAMRRLFALLEQVARSDATVLLEGETGTGKSALAEAIHLNSQRAGGPFVAVDCGALSHYLLESELFGHERGAFTGAVESRVGLFETASSGTILLDNIGELPFDMQPKLLRALERRRIRRVGSSREVPINVRLIGTTHRDLRRAVNQKTFRSDLWYRINTFRVLVPSLRQRRDDIPALVTAFYRELLDDPAASPPSDLVRTMMAGMWKGNVRELRSAVERSLIGPSGVLDNGPVALANEDTSFRAAKSLAVAEWERRYIAELLPAFDGNVSRAARAAKMNRSHLSELVRRHGLVDIREIPFDE